MKELGKKYKYIRFDVEKQDVIDSEGILIACYLDSTNRVLYNVKEMKDGKPEHFNIDAVCLEPAEGFKEIFSRYLSNIKSAEKDAELKSKAIIDETNKVIDVMHIDILGEPIKVEE
jgi:hypothetical protein